MRRARACRIPPRKIAAPLSGSTAASRSKECIRWKAAGCRASTARIPGRAADRESLRVLSALCVGDRLEGSALLPPSGSNTAQIRRRVEGDPARRAYQDLALTPVTNDDDLEIFQAADRPGRRSSRPDCRRHSKGYRARPGSQSDAATRSSRSEAFARITSATVSKMRSMSRALDDQRQRELEGVRGHPGHQRHARQHWIVDSKPRCPAAPGTARLDRAHQAEFRHRAYPEGPSRRPARPRSRARARAHPLEDALFVVGLEGRETRGPGDRITH